MNILLISASTRPDRKSHSVALHLKEQITQRDGHTADILDLRENFLPLFHGRMDTDHGHAHTEKAVVWAQKSIEKAQAIIWVAPEYNGGIATPLKNLIDSFDPELYASKVIGVAAVSAGPMGGIRAALQMQQEILALYGYPIPTMLLVGQVQNKFKDDGSLLDAAFSKKIGDFLDEFLWLSEAVETQKSRS